MAVQFTTISVLPDLAQPPLRQDGPPNFSAKFDIFVQSQFVWAEQLQTMRGEMNALACEIAAVAEDVFAAKTAAETAKDEALAAAGEAAENAQAGVAESVAAAAQSAEVAQAAADEAAARAQAGVAESVAAAAQSAIVAQAAAGEAAENAQAGVAESVAAAAQSAEAAETARDAAYAVLNARAWDSNEQYTVGAVWGEDGNLYVAVSPSQGVNPVGDDGTHWRQPSAGAAVSLAGPTNPPGESPSLWTITNYNAFSTYSVVASHGVAAISGGTITWTPAHADDAATQTLTVTVNGTACLFEMEIAPVVINDPVITTPENGGEIKIGAPIIGVEATSNNPDFVLNRTSWYVSNDEAGLNIEASSINDTENLNSWGVPEGLVKGQTYYVWREVVFRRESDGYEVRKSSGKVAFTRYVPAWPTWDGTADGARINLLSNSGMSSQPIAVLDPLNVVARLGSQISHCSRDSTDSTVWTPGTLTNVSIGSGSLICPVNPLRVVLFSSSWNGTYMNPTGRIFTRSAGTTNWGPAGGSAELATGTMRGILACPNNHAGIWFSRNTTPATYYFGVFDCSGTTPGSVSAMATLNHGVSDLAAIDDFNIVAVGYAYISNKVGPVTASFYAGSLASSNVAWELKDSKALAETTTIYDPKVAVLDPLTVVVVWAYGGLNVSILTRESESSNIWNSFLLYKSLSFKNQRELRPVKVDNNTVLVLGYSASTSPVNLVGASIFRDESGWHIGDLHTVGVYSASESYPGPPYAYLLDVNDVIVGCCYYDGSNYNSSLQSIAVR